MNFEVTGPHPLLAAVWGGYAWKPEFYHVRETMSERPYQRDHVRETMSEIPCQSHSCLRGCLLVSGRVYGLRVYFTPRGKTRPQLFTGKKR